MNCGENFIQYSTSREKVLEGNIIIPFMNIFFLCLHLFSKSKLRGDRKMKERKRGEKMGETESGWGIKEKERGNINIERGRERKKKQSL